MSLLLKVILNVGEEGFFFQSWFLGSFSRVFFVAQAQVFYGMPYESPTYSNDKNVGNSVSRDLLLIPFNGFLLSFG